MSITITDKDIILDNEQIYFEDIYNYAVTNNKTKYIDKVGESYIIRTNLTLKNYTYLTGRSISILIEGELFQIEKNSTIQLGDRVGDATYNSCMLNMPNVRLKYGFGNTNINNSGNVLFYGSIINMFGFWGLFEGNNHIELINNTIDGFGRISGINTIVKNNVFIKSHGHYGSISIKGKIKEFIDNKVYGVYPSQGLKCSLYHFPELGGDLIYNYGVLDGYEELAYIEKADKKYKLELLGTIVNNGYKLHRKDNNVDFYHKYKFKCNVSDIKGNSLSDVKLTIKNKYNDVVIKSNSDREGVIDIWVPYYIDIPDGKTNGVQTPHTLEFRTDDIVLKVKLYITTNLENIPIYLIKSDDTISGDIDYDKIEDMINAGINKVCECNKIESDITNKKLGQIMIGMSEDISETTEIIKSHNDISIIV